MLFPTAQPTECALAQCSTRTCELVHRVQGACFVQSSCHLIHWHPLSGAGLAQGGQLAAIGCLCTPVGSCRGRLAGCAVSGVPYERGLLDAPCIGCTNGVATRPGRSPTGGEISVGWKRCGINYYKELHLLRKQTHRRGGFKKRGFGSSYFGLRAHFAQNTSNNFGRVEKKTMDRTATYELQVTRNTRTFASAVDLARELFSLPCSCPPARR